MKRIVALLLVVMLSAGGSVWAKQVTAVGVGISAAEAENDALRNAVENIMGVLVDSQTLVSLNTVIHDSIYTNSRGFIQDYTVVDRRQEAGGWRVTINAAVDTDPNAKLMNALAREGIIVNNMRNAKIAVIIPEQHLRHYIPDPAGETAVVKTLLAQGFQNIIDVSIDRIIYNRPFNLNIEQLDSLAQSMQADILIVGEAFSEGAGDIGQYLTGQRVGVVSCKARLEAKMYIARTGQIIATDGVYGAGVDNLENIAAKKALTDAGTKMGQYLGERLLDSYSGNKQLLEVTVIAGDIGLINKVKTSLSGIYGVHGVNFNNYAQGRGTLSVQYSGSPQTLATLLQESVDCELQVREITFNTLTVAVY